MIILETHNVSKSFGGVKAVVDLSIAVNQGEIFGIIGPNGSGKTTLFNVLTGSYTPTSGAYSFDGQDITGLAPHETARRGIARTLLQASEERLQVSRIRLSVRASNQPAISLYSSFGYQQHSIWSRYYSDGEDALILQKSR